MLGVVLVMGMGLVNLLCPSNGSIPSESTDAPGYSWEIVSALLPEQPYHMYPTAGVVSPFMTRGNVFWGSNWIGYQEEGYDGFYLARNLNPADSPYLRALQQFDNTSIYAVVYLFFSRINEGVERHGTDGVVRRFVPFNLILDHEGQRVCVPDIISMQEARRG